MEQLFPLARPDGSTSVGVRFDVAAEGARHALESYVVEWRRSAHPALLTPLATPPSVEEVSASLVDVVFDGRDRRGWKDAAVAFASGVPESAGRLLGFYDRVGCRMHPASGPAD